MSLFTPETRDESKGKEDPLASADARAELERIRARNDEDQAARASARREVLEGAGPVAPTTEEIEKMTAEKLEEMRRADQDPSTS